MYPDPQSLKQPILISSELIIIKSIALGLGCSTIKNLLEISESEFENRLRSIFSKLQECNLYSAVEVAFKKGLLNKKEFASETTKSFALAFASKNINRLQTHPATSKNALWELYDLLLDFQLQLETQQCTMKTN